MSQQALAEALQRDLDALRRQSATRTLRLLALVSVADLARTFPRFAEAASLGVQADRRAAIRLAQAAYMAMRRDAGAGGQFAPRAPDAVPTDVVVAQLRGAVVAVGKAATGRGESLARAGQLIASATTGTAGKLVMAAGREAVMASSVADPAAQGWQRVGTGTSCAFCLMLLGRGAVYTESTARFASHPHCDCAAAPAFGGRPVPVDLYRRGLRERSDADRARVREWLSRNPDAG